MTPTAKRKRRKWLIIDVAAFLILALVVFLYGLLSGGSVYEPDIITLLEGLL